MINKSILALIGTVSTAIVGSGTWVGGVKAVDWLDNRYAPVQAVEDVQWTTLKNSIREIRADIAAAEEAGNEALANQLRGDLEDTIDRLCRTFPDDRECKK